MIEADILIIGNGVAAYAMALALKKKGVKNILIAGREPCIDENIVETLPLAAYDLLCTLGLGDLVEKHPVSNGIISKWGGRQVLVKESVFEVFETSWQLNKQTFVDDCHNQIIRENISCITVSQLQNVQRDENAKWQLQFKNGRREYHIAASFVVDASGKSSVFARRMGAKKIMFDQQVAVTGVFSAEQKPGNKISSFIESLPDAWCFSGLSGTNTRFVTLFTDADILNDLKLNKKQQWLAYLNQAELFCSLAGKANLVGLSVCPASSFFTEPTNGQGWLAIGDACYSVDPLTSGGLFHSLHTAISSADCLLKYLGGETSALQELYEANRLRFENYLHQRLEIYRSVTRFPDSKYWERRHEKISLNPNQVIHCHESFSRWGDIKTLNQYLTGTEWEELYALCRTKSPAHIIVSNFSKIRPAVPARRTILALQFLIEQKLLVQ